MSIQPAILTPRAGTLDQVSRLTRPYLDIQPLAGFTSEAPQTATSQSQWIKLSPGMALELDLEVTGLTPGGAAGLGGSLDIEIQDVHNPEDTSEQTTLLTVQFDQCPAFMQSDTDPTIPVGPSVGNPFKSKISAVTKGWVLVTATLGAETTGAVWVIKGRGYASGRNVVNT